MPSKAKHKPIHHIHITHTIQNIALSFINVYVPIYILTNGYTLKDTILFFMVLHISGLLFTFLIYLKIVKRWGLVKSLRLYYLFILLYFLLLSFLPSLPSQAMWLIAITGGVANLAYWVPVNILFLRHTDKNRVGSELSTFLALPKLFAIVGPLAGAILIPIVGFLPIFATSALLLAASYLPLRNLPNPHLPDNFNVSIRTSWKKIKNRKFLFTLEAIDNIIEESEWFWPIFVFIIIGSLAAPGIVGSLEALGSAAFILLIGKYTNKNSRKLIIFSSITLSILWVARIFTSTSQSAYVITVLASFAMTMFLVSYFSSIYRSVKDNSEEEFIILREIPTTIGRMIVFAAILLTFSNQRLFFLLPIAAIVLLVALLTIRKRITRSSEL